MCVCVFQEGLVSAKGCFPDKEREFSFLDNREVFTLSGTCWGNLCGRLHLQTVHGEPARV